MVRAETIPLGTDELGLFASPEYLDCPGVPATVEDLADQCPVSFVSSMPQVDDLDVGRRHLPEMKDSIAATNPIARFEATRAGCIGLIATFLPDRIAIDMDYWFVTRANILRLPAAASVVRELQRAAAGLPGLPPDTLRA